MGFVSHTLLKITQVREELAEKFEYWNITDYKLLPASSRSVDLTMDNNQSSMYRRKILLLDILYLLLLKSKINEELLLYF